MSVIDKIIRSLLFCYTIFYVGNFFFPVAGAKAISSGLLFGILCLSLPSVRRFNRNVCIGFFSCGLAVFLLTGAPLANIAYASLENGGLVALYTLIPVMGMPFFYNDYQGELGNIARRHTSSVLPFLLFILLSSYFLALTIYMGCLVILYHLFIKKAEEYKSAPLFHTALLQGYVASGFVGPSWASTSIITNRLHLTWLDIMPAGAVFSVLMLTGTSVALWRAVKSNPEQYPRVAPDKSVIIDWRRVRALGVLAVVLVGGIMLINYWTRWSMYIIIPLIALPFAFFTALAQDKLANFYKGAAAYYHERLINGKSEFCLFIVAGFLSSSIEYSKVGLLAVEFLPETLFQYPPLVAFAIIGAMTVMAVIGVHPVVSAPSIAMALSAGHIGLNEISFAMLLLSGWVLGIMISPFAIGIMMVAAFAQKSTWEVGPLSNWRFAAGMVVVFSLAVGVLHRLTS